MQELTKKEIRDYVLKLSGKVSLLEAIEIGHNYTVGIEGSITRDELKDNQDGSFDRIYRFEPVIVKIINPKGETIKSKDVRSSSRLLRNLLWVKWKEDNRDLSDEDYYQKVNNYVRANIDRIIERAF